MKQCPQCSAKFDDSMVFCPDCGCKLEDTAESNTPVQNNGYQYNTSSAPKFKYCPHCGNKCDPLAVICVKCGLPFQNINMNKVPAYNDVPSTLLKAACFFVPILGLILYLIEKDKHPVSAKAYGKMSLIGLIVYLVLVVLYVIFIIAMFLISVPRFAPIYPEWEEEYYYYDNIKMIIGNIFTIIR